MENRFKRDGAPRTFNKERNERSPREARSEGGYSSSRGSDSGRTGGTRERRSFNPNFDSEGRVKRDFNRSDRRSSEDGGFKPRREGGSFNRREGGFDRNERREGFTPRREGNFNRTERREGFSPRGEGNFNRPERREGFTPRREGGFNRGEKREGFTPRGERDFNRTERGERDFNRTDRREGFTPRGERDFNRTERREGFTPRREGTGYNSEGRAERGSSYNRGPRTSGFSPRPQRSGNRPSFNREERGDGSKYTPRTERYTRPKPEVEYSEPAPIINREIRLNRYIAMSGVCSRREADKFIESGVVSVNGTVVTELGTKIKNGDEIHFEGELIRGEKKVYVLMNKPKGYVTTLDDPHAEKNIMELLEGKISERIYPVGRLDKNSLGVLLLTNDGDMARELTHPSFEKKKIYHVFLDKNVSESDLERLAQGIELEDGIAFADEVSYVDGNKNEIGVEIHSGRNRIVRRMFEHLGYRIQKLDRVYFAGLTKKNLKRGMWRYLTPSEISSIKSGKKK